MKKGINKSRSAKKSSTAQMSPDVREVNAIEKKSDVSKIETNPD